MIRIEPLGPQHDRPAFKSGEESLDTFLRRFARQNAALGVGVTFVAVEEDTPRKILGYYTLSSSSVARADVPPDLKASSKLPRYPVPAALVGRLAVDQTAQGQGIGTLLMMDALARVLRIAGEMGIHAIEVVALHEKARAFYERLGFVGLQDNPLHLFLPLAVAQSLLEG